MRGLALSLAALLAGCASDPPGYDTPESVLHDPTADVYLVSNIHGAPLDKDNNGYIARVEPGQGGSMQRYWIAGGRDGVTLHAPKGMTIVGETLWVTDIDVVRRFNRTSGAPLGEVAIPGASFLNDCAAAPDGTVYVTDSGLDAAFGPTGTDAIWRIAKDGTATALIRGEELGQPNGIVARPAGVYVVSWRDGTFYEVDRTGRRTVIGAAPKAKLDGLVRTDRGYYTTSWEGECIYYFPVTGGCEPLPGRVEQPADLGIDAARGLLLVPLFGGNAVETVVLPPR